MKTMKFLLALLSIAAVAACCAHAQTTTCVGTNCYVTVTPSPTGAVVQVSGDVASVTAPVSVTGDVPAGLASVWNVVKGSGVLDATNYSVEPYLTYAPNAPKSDRIGGGILAVYNVNNYVGAGLGVDYLGEFNLVSANVTLKLPLKPFKNLDWFNGKLKDVEVVPFALAGVGKSFASGADGAIAITDAGGYVQFGHLWGGRFNVGLCYGRWDNAGIYSGPRAHVFAGWSKGF